jgi:hypothetical protein
MKKQFVSKHVAFAAAAFICFSAMLVNSNARADDYTGICTLDDCTDLWYGPVIWVETLPNGCKVDVQYYTRTASCLVPIQQEVMIEKIWPDAGNTCTALTSVPPTIGVQTLFEESMLQLLSDASDPSLHVPGMGAITGSMPTSELSPCLTVYSFHEGTCWEYDNDDPGSPVGVSFHSCTTEYDCCQDQYTVCYNSAAGGSNLVWTKTSTGPVPDCDGGCFAMCGPYSVLNGSVLTSNSTDKEYGS